MFRLSAHGGAREPIFEKRVRAPPAPSTAIIKILGYSIRNGKFMEPHFQISATKTGGKEVTKIAVALEHSRECTEEPMSPLQNIGLMEKFGARA